MTGRTEREKMLAGELYDPGDPELVAIRKTAQSLMRDYNATIYGEAARSDILKHLLGSVGTSVAIRAPFHVDYGKHIHVGERVFLNYGVVILDVCEVRIGDGTQIGPYAQLIAGDHPRDAETRAKGLENGRPVAIGRDCWIGAGALILPGVTVGDGAVVGAGAVVTRDVAAGATVVGNPARPRPAG